MFIEKLTVNDGLDYVLNENSIFDDLESDSGFYETDTLGNNSDEIGANLKIDDTELHNLDENKDPDIPGNDDNPLWIFPVTSKNENEKQPQEYRCCKTDILEDVDIKHVIINTDPDILRIFYDYFKYFINDEMFSCMAYQTSLYTTQKDLKSINTDTKELEHPDISWTSYDYFKNFVNDEMLLNMAYQSNLYTAQ